MLLRRSRPAPPSSGLLRVTVELTVEVRHEDSIYAFSDTEHPATPLDPVRPLYTQTADLQRQSTMASVTSTMPPLANTPFSEAALHNIAQTEIRNFQAVATLPNTSAGRPIFPVQNATRLIWADVGGLVVLGQQLLAKARLKDHAKAIPPGEIEIRVPVHVWLLSLEMVQFNDLPLFFMLRDSLHAHTPQHILFRWNALRYHMRARRKTLPRLIREAEEIPRQKWPPLVLELYFLLLDHNEALAQDISNVLNLTEGLECQLSAYCAALRIRFYLWRMSRSNPTCRRRTYQREAQAELFEVYCKQLSNLVAQEFYRLQEPDSFGNVGRELVSEPISIEKITTPLDGDAKHFCSICQDEHLGIECISPLECNCSFGRDCLQPLLNHDTPSSYSCPNCRTRLHEPLEWRHVDALDGWDMRLGLLWALRSNIRCLQYEIKVDPEPFTARQQMTGLFHRMVSRH